MKQNHLTIEERELIEDKLKENCNFTLVEEKLNKCRTTIATNTCKNVENKLCRKTCRNFKKNVNKSCNKSHDLS